VRAAAHPPLPEHLPVHRPRADRRRGVRVGPHPRRRKPALLRARRPRVRTVLVHADADGRSTVVSGLKDLVVLNTAGSEFHGFYKDEYTTLAETTDRVLATAVDARWRHTDSAESAPEADWDKSYARARAALMTAFADTHSLSLQQTLYAMGERLLSQDDRVAEVRLVLPNRHHFAVDLAPFGLTNENEVFYAADRPYGLIEGTLSRAGAPPDPGAWE